MTALDSPPLRRSAPAEPPSTPRPQPVAPALRHEPALDGLRGLAVAGVLLFHGGVSWAQGGFLGVSTFFTLSGFLITTLLLAEHQRRGGTIGLTRFWSRRFRRLMPAALACLAGVCVFAVTVATAAQLVGLRGDALASLFYVANWRFIAEDRSYAEVFSDPSPVQHFWSLAIEEQFYVVFPLLLLGLLAVGRGSRQVVGVVLGALALGSVALCIALSEPGLDPARVYYGTDTRAAELLIGAVLACVVFGRGEVRRHAVRVVVAVAGIAGLALTLFWWATVDQRTPWLYEGGLGVYALGSAAVVLAATNAGPVRALLAVAPLRLLGRISYGVYLFHWPIFLWLTPRRTGLSLWPLFSLRVAVTLLVAVASYHLLEWPIRAGRWPRGERRLLVAPVAVTCLVVAILGVTWNPPKPALDFTVERAPLPPATAEPPPEDATAEGVVDRVLLMGDSVMHQAFPAIEARLVPRDVEVGFAGGPGTGPLYPQGSWSEQIDAWTERFGPDVVVIEACCDYTDFADEIYERADGTEVLPGTEAVFDAWDDEARAVIARAVEGGAEVLWVLPPPVRTNGFYGPLEAHVERLREVYADYEEIEGVTLVDWDEAVAPEGEFTWEVSGPGGATAMARVEDGVHMTDFGNELIAGVTVDAIFGDGRRAPGAPSGGAGG